MLEEVLQTVDVERSETVALQRSSSSKSDCIKARDVLVAFSQVQRKMHVAASEMIILSVD